MMSVCCCQASSSREAFVRAAGGMAGCRRNAVIQDLGKSWREMPGESLPCFTGREKLPQPDPQHPLSCTILSRMLLTLGVSLIWSKGCATETNVLPWGKGGQMVPSKEDFASTAEPKG